MDTLDVVSLEEAKVALSIGSADDTAGADLARLITAVSRRLDDGIGPVVRRAATHRASGGRRILELPLGPVYSVTSVTEYQGTSAVTVTEETLGTSPSDGWAGERYDPDPTLYSGLLVRRSGGSDMCWYPGQGNVQVVYTAGRAADTSAVDARHKEAAILMLRNLWRSYETSVGGVDEYDVPVGSFPTFAVPRAVKELLAREWQTHVGFG